MNQTARMRLFRTVLTAALFVLLLVLMEGAAAETLTFPRALQMIEAEAFCGDTSLENVILPDGIQTIGNRAFASSSLRKIYLPDSLTGIASDAFSGCIDLRAEVYEGSYALQYCETNGILYDIVGIYAHPVDATVDRTCLVTFSVGVSGSGFTYQWQVKPKDASVWTDCEGLIEPDMTFTPEKSDSRAQYRCVVTAPGGRQIASDAATLVVVRHIAVLIGNGDYEDSKEDLAGPPNDIVAFNGALGSLSQGWEVNAYSNQSADGIQSAISSGFSDSDSDDICLFYYSGHGSTNGSLCGVNDTYLSPYQLEQSLSGATAGKVMVIIDACYSGNVIARGKSGNNFNSAIISAFSGKTVPGNIPTRSGELIQDGKYYVITACTSNQLSADWEDDDHHSGGMMSIGLITEGMGCTYPNGDYSGTMPGDTDQDGSLTLGELTAAIVDYVTRELITYTEFTTEDYNNTSSYGSTSFVFFHRY